MGSGIWSGRSSFRCQTRSPWLYGCILISEVLRLSRNGCVCFASCNKCLRRMRSAGTWSIVRERAMLRSEPSFPTETARNEIAPLAGRSLLDVARIAKRLKESLPNYPMAGEHIARQQDGRPWPREVLRMQCPACARSKKASTGIHGNPMVGVGSNTSETRVGSTGWASGTNLRPEIMSYSYSLFPYTAVQVEHLVPHKGRDVSSPRQQSLTRSTVNS